MPTRPKILYLAAGNPAAPGAGMDVVVREHILELSALENVDLHGIVVSPGVLGKAQDMSPMPWKNFTKFVGDAQNLAGGARALAKIKHVLTGGRLADYGYLAADARKSIRQELAKGYDLIIVDHAATFANIAPWGLKKYCPHLIFIAHDVTHKSLSDAAYFKQSILAKMYSKVQALQVWLLEIYMIRQAARSIFISEWDRRSFAWIKAGRLSSLCPSLSASRVAADETAGGRLEKTIIFIGSPGFPPNKFALEWIIRELAPRLERLDPTLGITLVGKDTPQMKGADARNISAPGFVSDEGLAALLRDGICMISPVVHGSGLKIKVLEAFAAGCPVFATEESLHGFEFMNVAPRLDIHNPDAAAQVLVKFANDRAAQEAERAHVRKEWAAFIADRKGKLGRIVESVLGAGQDV